MLVYRIAKEKYIEDLTGFGAKLYGGRWNRPGVAVLYTSSSRALAMLELIVHFDALSALRQQYCFAVIEIDAKKIIEISSEFYASLNESSLHIITESHFVEQNKSILKVPSVVIPQEYNFLLNPVYVDSNLYKIIDIEEVKIVERIEGLMSGKHTADK
jgi:RES domain-containing protein